MHSDPQVQLRAREIEYWGSVARDSKLKNGFQDNIWKRQALIRRLLDYNWISETTLEIGVGGGLTMACINLLTLGRMSYLGTDLAPEFCEYVSARWKLQMAMCDVRNIPAESEQFSRIVAFDTFEHVRPEDRDAGYAEIKRLLAPEGLVILNIPCNETLHDLEFDHGFTGTDADRLCEVAGLKIIRWEPYEVTTPGGRIEYIFAVMQ